MKKYCLLACLLSAAFTFVSAQSGFRGQSMNGSTGLFSIPSGRIGWDTSYFALDAGYRAVINNERGIAHIPAITASLFKWMEISAAFDFQPEVLRQTNNDLLLGLKFKIPTGSSSGTSIAIGGNTQFINIGNNNFGYTAIQPYAAVTFAGKLFNMNAETTVVFGKTFFTGGHSNNSDIDFGMGFDLILFPDVFGNAVHWIIDFANFSYSDNSWPNSLYRNTSSAMHRGIMNTGFRIDLSVFSALSRYKFLVDFVFNDLFDAGYRSFTTGAVFGFQLR
jgi:hypothetical protein